MIFVGTLFLAAGAVLLVIAAWGVNALPDALSRQHAATKAGTLALALVCVGVWLFQPSLDWGWRLALILGFLLATLPVASHLLARAAVIEGDLCRNAEDAPLVGGDSE